MIQTLDMINITGKRLIKLYFQWTDNDDCYKKNTNTGHGPLLIWRMAITKMNL